MSAYKIGFFGAGKMAEGILSAIADKSSVIMAEKVDARAEELVKKYGVTTTDDVKGVAASAHLIFLAVRPQDVDAVAAEVIKVAFLITSAGACGCFISYMVPSFVKNGLVLRFTTHSILDIFRYGR